MVLGSLVHRDQWDYLGLVDHWGRLVSQDPQARLDKKVLLVILDPQVLLVLTDLRDNQVFRDRQGPLGQLGQMVNQAL